jgi:hypothetical protein
MKLVLIFCALVVDGCTQVLNIEKANSFKENLITSDSFIIKKPLKNDFIAIDSINYNIILKSKPIKLYKIYCLETYNTVLNTNDFYHSEYIVGSGLYIDSLNKIYQDINIYKYVFKQRNSFFTLIDKDLDCFSGEYKTKYFILPYIYNNNIVYLFEFDSEKLTKGQRKIIEKNWQLWKNTK